MGHNNQIARPLTRAVALSVCAILGSLSTTVKADSYLNQMLNNPNPDFTVEYYQLDQAGSLYSLYGPYPITTEINTMISVNNGPDAGSYGGFLNSSFDTSGPIPTGSMEQDISLDGTSSIPMFSSNTLLDFGPIIGQPGYSYYFVFRENTATSFANIGDIIGGYLTVNATSGDPVDIKEFVMVPTPAAMQGGILLMGGLAFCGVYRRLRSRSAMELTAQ